MHSAVVGNHNVGPVLLGIDLGTSSVKAAVFDRAGRLLGRGLAPNHCLPGPPGSAEQDPQAWWLGCCRAVRAALAEAGVDPAGLAGIGVCGFHHCPVLLDADGRPTRPAIVTHDRRLGGSLEELRAGGVLDQVADVSGSQVVAGHFPPIYHYLLHHDPQSVARSRWILLAKDYLRFRLTGRIGTEICDATGTHLVAMPARDWSERLCDLLQVDRARLPEIGEPAGIAGQVTPEAAAATGLPAGTPVVYGGGDSHCALLGLGVTGSGEVGLLLGTNSTLRASFAGLPARGHESHVVWVQQHVVPGRFTVSASSMAGASVLSWFADTLLAGDQTYADLEELAAGVPAGCDGLLFHPYIYGERSPFYDPQARGAFLGVAHWHTRGHFVRAVMEGVAFSIANCFDAIQAVAVARGEPIRVVRTGAGGGGRLPLWRQIIADALDLSLDVVDVPEPGCLGAAMLAGEGVGLPLPAAPAAGSQVCPNPGRARLYRDRRQAFNAAYAALAAR